MGLLNLWGILLEGPESYQRRVSDLIRGTGSAPGGIGSNPVGLVILSCIEQNPHQLTIRRSTETCNAGTGTDGKEDDAHPKGQLYYLGSEDNPKTLQNERFDQSKSKGTGRGTGTYIEFSPGISSCGPAGTVEADAVLLHEMVHALRKMQGLENSTPLDASYIPQYGDTEEWLAILVENVYQSAKGRTVFRGAHDAHTKLQPPQNTSEGFLSEPTYRSLLRGYYATWKPVFRNLAAVPANFNPFRAYAADPAKYAKPPKDHDYASRWYERWG